MKNLARRILGRIVTWAAQKLDPSSVVISDASDPLKAVESAARVLLETGCYLASDLARDKSEANPEAAFRLIDIHATERAHSLLAVLSGAGVGAVEAVLAMIAGTHLAVDILKDKLAAADAADAADASSVNAVPTEPKAAQPATIVLSGQGMGGYAVNH